MIVRRSSSRSAKPRMVWRAARRCLTIQYTEPPISSSARFGRNRVTSGTTPSLSRACWRRASVSRLAQPTATLEMLSSAMLSPWRINYVGSTPCLAVKPPQAGEPEEGEEAHHVRHHGDEDRRRDGWIDVRLVERHRDEDSRQARDEVVDQHRQSDDGAEVRAAEDQPDADADEQAQSEAVRGGDPELSED